MDTDNDAKLMFFIESTRVFMKKMSPSAKKMYVTESTLKSGF